MQGKVMSWFWLWLLIFMWAAGTVLCFGFKVRIMWITQQGEGRWSCLHGKRNISAAFWNFMLALLKVNAKTVKRWSITATLCYTRSLQVKSFPFTWVGSFIFLTPLSKTTKPEPRTSVSLLRAEGERFHLTPTMGTSGCLGPRVPSREGNPVLLGGSAAKHLHRWAPTAFWPMVQHLDYHHSVN